MANITVVTPPKPQVAVVEVPGLPGPPGPSNSLVIGTVAVSTNGLAAAEITGTAPNQILNLTVPLGPTGDAGLPGDMMASDTAILPTGNVTLASWTVPSTKIRTLSGNATITTLPTDAGATQSGTITVILKQAASGGPFTVTWPSTLEWNNDAPAPAMPTAANSELIVHLFWTGTSWRGIVGGIFYP